MKSFWNYLKFDVFTVETARPGEGGEVAVAGVGGAGGGVAAALVTAGCGSAHRQGGACTVTPVFSASCITLSPDGFTANCRHSSLQ